jgi:formiminoglutamase
MKLPLLLSVPHGGVEVPPEARELCALTHDEIVKDGDEGAAEIYAFSDSVTTLVTTSVGRAIVDMNRGADDFRKDGVIKTHTCWDVPVWRQPPSLALVQQLLSRYHAPYHARLSAPDPTIRLAVDCHTMAAFGPPVGPDPGKERPPVCLSNADGTLPAAWFDLLFQCFDRVFPEGVERNRPFQGGYIIRTHAAEGPWVQLELSRAPFDTPAGKRRRVLQALTDWCTKVDSLS